MSHAPLPRHAGHCTLLALAAGICVGCAEGSSTPSDARRREGGARDVLRSEGPDLAAPDARVELVARLDLWLADRGRDAVLDQPPRDRAGDQMAVPDVGCGCGAGMKCADGACVCDPATCAGCCTADGKACKTGKDSAECGTGGVTCKACSTADSCKTASCATGACVLSRKNGAAYPCPGAFGTVCGGGTGIICFTGLTCVTFTSGAKGFCSKNCTSSTSACNNPPAGTTECSLSAGGQKFCGFICDPWICPAGLFCDYYDAYCKP